MSKTWKNIMYFLRWYEADLCKNIACYNMHSMFSIQTNYFCEILCNFCLEWKLSMIHANMFYIYKRYDCYKIELVNRKSNILKKIKRFFLWKIRWIYNVFILSGNIYIIHIMFFKISCLSAKYTFIFSIGKTSIFG